MRWQHVKYRERSQAQPFSLAPFSLSLTFYLSNSNNVFRFVFSARFRNFLFFRFGQRSRFFVRNIGPGTGTGTGTLLQFCSATDGDVLYSIDCDRNLPFFLTLKFANCHEVSLYISFILVKLICKMYAIVLHVRTIELWSEPTAHVNDDFWNAVNKTKQFLHKWVSTLRYINYRRYTFHRL